METNDIRKQMSVTQTQLNNTTDAEQRRKITNQLTILKYKAQIEEIKHKIQMLQNS